MAHAKLNGLSRHEVEALTTLVKFGCRKSAQLYLVAIRRLVDVSTGVVGDRGALTADGLLVRLQRDTEGRTLASLLSDLERAHLVRPLPAPKGRLRFLLPLVDRVAPGRVA